MRTQRDEDGLLIREALVGDDAEADAFVYSLYGDVCEGIVDSRELADVMEAGECYEDDIEETLRYASYIQPGRVVERILIHLERQTSPKDFEHFGPRVVPFYNYLQAAFVLFEDGRLSARSVMKVAQDLAVRHHFDGGALARSYLELARRGHVAGSGIAALVDDYADWVRKQRIAGASELGEMVRELQDRAPELPPPVSQPIPRLDYRSLVVAHNPRRHKR
jgi:hypothetical protein